MRNVVNIEKDRTGEQDWTYVQRRKAREEEDTVSPLIYAQNQTHALITPQLSSD
jgi:hypothetical protein